MASGVWFVGEVTFIIVVSVGFTEIFEPALFVNEEPQRKLLACTHLLLSETPLMFNFAGGEVFA